MGYGELAAVKSEENYRPAQDHSGNFIQIGKCSCNGVVVQVVCHAKHVPSCFKHCVRLCSSFTLVFPLPASPSERENKQAVSYLHYLPAGPRLMCVCAYIMGSRCTCSNSSYSDETSIKWWSAATAVRVSGGVFFGCMSCNISKKSWDIFHISMHKQTLWIIWSCVPQPTKAKLIFWILLYALLLVQDRANT